MFDLRASAMRATNLGELMIDREKGTTEELIECGVVTVTDVEFIELPNDSGKLEEQVAFITEEFDDKYFYAGTVFKNTIYKNLKDLDGDVDALRNAYQTQNLKVEFSKGKTKDNKPCTKVRVL